MFLISVGQAYKYVWNDIQYGKRCELWEVFPALCSKYKFLGDGYLIGLKTIVSELIVQTQRRITEKFQYNYEHFINISIHILS